MKVGIIVPGFSADEADWCIPVLVDVVRELSRRVDLHIFALRYPYRWRRYRVYGAEVHALGGAQVRGLRRAALLATAGAALVAEHRRGRFDVLHGLWADEPGAVAVAVGRLLKVPAVVSVMGGEVVALPDIRYGGRLSWSGRALSSFALRGAHAITAGCDTGMELAAHSLLPRWRREIERLVWGIDPRVFDLGEAPARLEGAFRILHVGSLVPIKDQLTLLRAVARLRASEPGVHLHVVGDGPLRSELCRQAGALELTGSVTFHGHMPRHELGSFYRGADVFALSSRFESQSVVVLEAALCGLPLVGTDVGLLADFAPDSAVAVEVGDDAALAGAFGSVRDARARRSLALAAQKRVNDECLAAHTVERLAEVYR